MWRTSLPHSDATHARIACEIDQRQTKKCVSVGAPCERVYLSMVTSVFQSIIFESIIPSLLFGLWVGPSPLFGAHSTWYIDIGNLQTVVKHTLCKQTARNTRAIHIYPPEHSNLQPRDFRILIRLHEDAGRLDVEVPKTGRSHGLLSVM